MVSEHVSNSMAQRSRKIWWTIHVLDRQMSVGNGLPMAVRDEDITAQIPSFGGSVQKETALIFNVKLSKIISQISRKVYGAEGRLGREYLANTREVLSQIAEVTDQLNHCFGLSLSPSMSGISRVSGYLHLLHHQVRHCVTLRRPANQFLVCHILNETCILQFSRHETRSGGHNTMFRSLLWECQSTTFNGH